jgi:hypothetical protein
MATFQEHRKTTMTKQALQNQSSSSDKEDCSCKKDTKASQFRFKKLSVDGYDYDGEVSTTCSYSENTSFLGDSFHSTIGESVRAVPLNEEGQQRETELEVPLNDDAFSPKQRDVIEREAEIDEQQQETELELRDFTIPLNDVSPPQRRGRIEQAVDRQPMKQELLLDSAYTAMEEDVLLSDYLGGSDDDDDDSVVAGDDEQAEYDELLRQYLALRLQSR